MADQDAELIVVKLDDGWFLSLKRGDPLHGLMISEDCARLLAAADALLSACKTAYAVIEDCSCSNGNNRLLADSALVQLDTVIRMASGESPTPPSD